MRNLELCSGGRLDFTEFAYVAESKDPKPVARSCMEVIRGQKRYSVVAGELDMLSRGKQRHGGAGEHNGAKYGERGNTGW